MKIFLEINQKVPFFNNLLKVGIYITTCDDRSEMGRYDLNSGDKFWSFPLSSLGTFETSDKEVKTPEVQRSYWRYKNRFSIFCSIHERSSFWMLILDY